MEHISEALIEHSNFGDKRLSKRFGTIVNQLGANIGQSIPQSAVNTYQSKAVYRFMDNDQVTPQEMQSAEQSRIYEQLSISPPRVLIQIQDTTTLNYSHSKAKKHLPCLNYTTHLGYFAHTSLLMNDKGLLYGMSEQDFYGRSPESLGQGRRATSIEKSSPIETKENDRWLRHFDSFQSMMSAEGLKNTQGFSVSDRESDLYELFARKNQPNVDLIVRCQYDRFVAQCDQSDVKVLSHIAQCPSQGQYFIDVLMKDNKHHTRNVELEVRFCPIAIQIPETLKYSSATPKLTKKWAKNNASISLYFVQVKEVNPPQGVEGIEWTIITTKKITNYWEAIEIVRIYALRWRIEIFHLVLKEGCAVEKLQLEKPERLLNAITLYSIIAAQITQLRYFALCDPTAPMTVSGCHTKQYNILVHYLNCNHRFKLPIEKEQNIPTIKDFLQLVAFLGGGKKQNEWGIRALWIGWNKADIIFKTLIAIESS
jgi:Transposase DNA-binding